jgi:hypothetical protein
MTTLTVTRFDDAALETAELPSARYAGDQTAVPPTDHLTSESLSGVLGAVARTLQAEPDVDTTLAAIVKAAVDHVPGAEYAGISMVERGRRIRTVAPTAEVVSTIDEVQYRTGQGSCLNGIAEHEVFRTGDLTSESRWPLFTPAAAATGMRSMLAYRLFVTDTTLGSLNLYSTKMSGVSSGRLPCPGRGRSGSAGRTRLARLRPNRRSFR